MAVREIGGHDAPSVGEHRGRNIEHLTELRLGDASIRRRVPSANEDERGG